MRKPRTLALACALTATACGSGDPDLTGPSPAEIVGVTWRLDALAPAGGASAAPPAGTFTLLLEESGALAIVADCNRCNGRYALGDATLVVEGGLLACTRAFCPSAPFDTEYVRVLGAVQTWESGGSSLTLSGESGRLRFQRAGP